MSTQNREEPGIGPQGYDSVPNRDDPGVRGGIGPETYPEDTRLGSVESLEGMAVQTIDGALIGEVEDVFVDDGDAGFMRYICVQGEWLGERRLVVPVDSVSSEPETETLVVPYTREQVSLAPSYDRDRDLTPDDESDVYRHYGRRGYWEDVRARQQAPLPTPEVARAFHPDAQDRAEVQAEPAPTPEIAEAEAEDMAARGEDTRRVRVRRWGV